jgi:hypothetical protein
MTNLFSSLIVIISIIGIVLIGLVLVGSADWCLLGNGRSRA